MDENSDIYKVVLGISGLFIAFFIKPFWQAMKGGWEASSSNSNAQVRMIEVLQTELDGYRKRENENRDLLNEVYMLRLELKEAKEKLEEQSKHIEEQSQLIMKLRKEISDLKGVSV